MPNLRILHTNDIHGKLTSEKLSFLLSRRQDADVYFDSGDAVKAGNLALPIRPDPVWGDFRRADITASVPGNRESHIIPSGLKAKFEGRRHPVLCANWRTRNGSLVWLDSLVKQVGDIRVGVFGVMVPMVTPNMKTQAASQYLWDPPVESVKEIIADLRPQVDVLIALTHIGLTQDRILAEAYPQLDIILGGHSHDVLEKPEVVGGVPIAMGGSHGRFIGRYEIKPGTGLVDSELIDWP